MRKNINGHRLGHSDNFNSTSLVSFGVSCPATFCPAEANTDVVRIAAMTEVIIINLLLCIIWLLIHNNKSYKELR